MTGQPAHQEGSLIHPLLGRAERVLDAFALPVQDVGPGGKTRRHAIERGFILNARNATEAFGTAFTQAARLAGVAVVRLLEVWSGPQRWTLR
nr:hypothetical protein [Phyllobacterium salinisoli]